MYNIGIYLYLIGVAVCSIFNKKVRKMWRGELRTIKLLKEKVDPEARYVWFHAASLGEFEQGRPLMEHLHREHPEYKILLTFFSPSGYEVRKDYEGADIVCYLPLDTIRNSRRFLRAVRPVMAFFIKYEFWYNYLHILKHRGVPVYSVSSIFRPGQIFFKWYGRQYAHVLKCFSHFFVQNEVSRQLLSEKLGITQVSVVGDTRFDRVLQIRDEARQLPIIEDFVQSAGLVFVAGSSWEPDEDVYLPYFADRSWKLIIAPHVVSPARMAALRQRLEQQGKRVLLYSEGQEARGKGQTVQGEGLEAYDVLLIDCYGLLSSVYRYGQVAYVGGGFGVGIHNVLEAAVWGMPVIFGPNHEHFDEARHLKACGGGFAVGDAADFAVQMSRLSSDTAHLEASSQAAGQFVASSAGTTKKILQAIRLQ